MSPARRSVQTSKIGGPQAEIPGLKAVIGRTDTVLPIALGSADVPDAVHILRIIDGLGNQFGRMPAIREFAIRLLAGATDNAVAWQVKSLLQFVKDRVTYVRDPDGSEYVVSPIRLLQQISTDGVAYGDCDDHVLLLNSLLISIGIPAVPVGVKLNSADRFDHVISSANMDGTWTDLDPCAKSVSQPQYLERLVP